MGRRGKNGGLIGRVPNAVEEGSSYLVSGSSDQRGPARDGGHDCPTCNGGGGGGKPRFLLVWRPQYPPLGVLKSRRKKGLNRGGGRRKIVRHHFTGMGKEPKHDDPGDLKLAEGDGSELSSFRGSRSFKGETVGEHLETHNKGKGFKVEKKRQKQRAREKKRPAGASYPQNRRISST